MSYFKKHVLRGSHCYEQQQNTKPAPPVRPKKPFCNAKTEPGQEQPHRSVRAKEAAEHSLFESGKPRPSAGGRAVKEAVRAMPERQLPGLMLEGENSMQELLNSSINQFTKYLSDRDPLEQEHQELVAQNKDLRKMLEKLKTIIKQKLVSALGKQRQELNAVMEDYVQLITKLLADKEDLTASLELLERRLIDSQDKCQALARSQAEAQGRMEELTKDREQHIAKTKHQIDDFLQIIEQYEEEAEHEGQEGEQLRQHIAELEGQLSKAHSKGVDLRSPLPPKTQTLLQMLERVQQENRALREQLSEGGASERLAVVEREHEQEFMEYERAMRQTLNKKDECISRLSSIIEGYRERRGKESAPGYMEEEGSGSLE